MFLIYISSSTLFKSLFWKCDFYMTPHAVSLLVCLSVIISLKGGKLHCNAPIGAVVTYHEHFYEQSFPNPHYHLRTSPLHLQHSPTSSFIKSNLFLFFHRSGFMYILQRVQSIHPRTHSSYQFCQGAVPTNDTPKGAIAESGRKKKVSTLPRQVSSQFTLVRPGYFTLSR